MSVCGRDAGVEGLIWHLGLLVGVSGSQGNFPFEESLEFEELIFHTNLCVERVAPVLYHWNPTAVRQRNRSGAERSPAHIVYIEFQFPLMFLVTDRPKSDTDVNDLRQRKIGRRVGHNCTVLQELAFERHHSLAAIDQPDIRQRQAFRITERRVHQTHVEPSTSAAPIHFSNQSRSIGAAGRLDFELPFPDESGEGVNVGTQAMESWSLIL